MTLQPDSSVSATFINVVRFLSVASMLSGVLAVWRYEFTGFSRVIVATSVFTAFIGNMAVMQYLKAEPPPWATSLLTAFWLGLVAIGVLWVIQLGNGA
jgi:hypothetical protein